MDANNNPQKKAEGEDNDEDKLREELTQIKNLKQLRAFINKYDKVKKLSIDVEELENAAEGVKIISEKLNLSLSGRSLQKLASQLKKEQETYRENRRKLISFMQKFDKYCMTIPEKDAARVKSNAAFERYKEAKKYLERAEENHIVVVGDTSSGKSTFCNTLLGAYVLPVSAIPCTNVITEIHYCEKGSEMVKLHNATTKIWEVIPLAGESKPADKLSDKLNFGNYDAPPYDVIEIHWSSPLLQSGFVIVDTPGISESHVEINEAIQKQIEDYLPKATALFFVINSSIGGFSTQFAHLLSSLAARIDEQKDVKLMFNKKCTLFIANKWDQVTNDKRLLGSEGETKTLYHLQEEIKQFWHRDFDSSQIVKLQANTALLALQENTADPKEFVEFCRNLTPFMAGIFQLKLSIVGIGTENLLKLYHSTVKSHLTAKTMNLKSVRELRQKLSETNKKVEPMISSLKQEAAKEIWKVIEMLKESMISDQHKIIKECVYKVKDHKHREISTVHYIFDHALRTELEKYCNRWERKNKKFEEVANKMKMKAEEVLTPVVKEFQEILQVLNAIDPHEMVVFWGNLLRTSLAVIGGIIALPLGAALLSMGLGLGSAAFAISFVVGPVLLSTVAIKEAFNKDWKVYNENRDKYLDTFGRKTIESLWKTVTRDAVSKIFLQGDKELGNSLLRSEQTERAQEFLNALAKQCRAEEFINGLKSGVSNMYATAMNLLDTVEDDLRNPPPATIIEKYKECTQNAEKLLAHLGILCLNFTPVGSGGRLSSQVIMNSAQKKAFAIGGYSNVYEGEHDGKKIAIKRIVNKNKSYVIPLESDYRIVHSFCNACMALRQANHPNLVKYYGWCIDVESKQHEIVSAQLYLVMELCKPDLARKVFGNTRLREREVIDIALSIARGMQHLHEQGYIHKNLKFDNVLVDANGVIKLSDFGLVWTLEDRMAPELANHGYYGQPADVYIFGLMLWELWYGKRIPTNKPTLGGKQKKRDQPDMPADDQPPWAEVIRDCWKVAPVDRPLFKQIVEKLEAYKKQLECGDNFDRRRKCSKGAMDDNNDNRKKTEGEDDEDTDTKKLREELTQIKNLKQLRAFINKFERVKKLNVDVEELENAAEGVKLISEQLKLTLSGRCLKRLAAQLTKEQEVYRENRKKLISFMQKFDDYCTKIPEKDAAKVNSSATSPRYKEAKAYFEREEENYIVIVGDTSSGKSTFCNTLLGAFLLPVSAIPCTNVITEIHYCEKGSEKARLHNTEHDVWEEIQLAGKPKPADILNHNLSLGKDTYDRSPYDIVEIYWNSPLLQSGFVIVDTPGISDSHVEINEAIQQQIEAYLPKAIALFFVIDSSKGGFSTQFAHLLSSLATRINEEKDVKLMFNKKSTLFIANKWDQVTNDIQLLGGKTETDAENYLLSEIKHFWQSDFDASQLVKLQANTALLALQENTADPKEFTDFCRHLTPFMAGIFHHKLSIVAMRTENLLKLYHKTVKIHLTASSMDQNRVKELKKRLSDTNSSVDPNVSTLQEEATKLIWEVIIALREDMIKDQDKIFAPCIYRVKENRHKDITTVHSIFELALRTELERYCTLWERKNNRFEKVTKVIQKKAEDLLTPIVRELQTILQSLDAIDPHEIFNPWRNLLKLFAVVGGIIGLPLSVLLASLVLGSNFTEQLLTWSFSLSVDAIRNYIKQKQDWKEYNRNPGGYLTSCGREAIASLWEKVNKDSVRDVFILGAQSQQRDQNERALEFLKSLSNLCRVHAYIKELKGCIKDMHVTCENLLNSVEDDLRNPPPKATTYQYVEYTESSAKLLAHLGILHLDITPIGTDGRLSSQVIMNSAHNSTSSTFVDDLTNTVTLEPFAIGGFSQVYEGEYDGKKVAVKRLINQNKSFLISLEHDPYVLQSFCNECIALRQVNHPNLVKYYGWCIDVEQTPNSFGAQLYLVTERCESDLTHRVFGYGHLSEQDSIDIALSIARGMQYLHEHGYIHKDLKFDNVLVDANGVIKISDFGLSKKLTDVTGATNAGTPPYMAPEVNNRAYGHPADVYSFGLMLWELWYRKRIFTCVAPLGGLTAVEEFILFMRRGERPEFPADDQPPWVDLIKSCWKHSPVDRPVFSQVVQELEKLSKEA